MADKTKNVIAKNPAHLMPVMVKTFLPLAEFTSIFEDQHTHIVKPVMVEVKKCLQTPDPRQKVIVCPPGSGKTTTFIVDLIWRIAKEAKEAGEKNQLFVLTSPSTAINEDMFTQFDQIFKDNRKWDLLSDIGLNFQNLYNDPKDVLGRGLEIVVCTVQKLAENQHEFIKDKKITALISDEVHTQLGCPDNENYVADVGYAGADYEAKRYWKCRELKYNMWFGLTGTPTHSQKYDTENYHLISDKMEKSDWRLPFFENEIQLYNAYDFEQQVTDWFLEISTRNSICKYLKTKITDIDSISKLSEIKVTGMIRCGVEGALAPPPEKVRDKWNELCKQYSTETFMYDGVELPYHIGKCAIMTSEEKTGGSNEEVVKLLNDENSDYVAAAVIYIGTVGINITNLGVVSVLPLVKNQGDVDSSLQQLIGRMDRCKFIWRGKFANEVAQINDPEQRRLMAKLAVNTSSKKCLATQGALVESAYSTVRDNHILVENAEGTLLGFISIFREQQGYSSVSGNERELTYKNARKTKCEFPGCTCYEELVEGLTEGSKSERELNYQRILEVDHIDGDRENMDIENLITYCPNRHSIKTMSNEDYLNQYDS